MQVRHSRELCAAVVVGGKLPPGASGSPCVAVAPDGRVQVRFLGLKTLRAGCIPYSSAHGV